MPMSRVALPFLVLVALAAAPVRAAALETHLLDDALALDTPTDGLAGALQLGLARPAAGPEHAILGCMASMLVPGLGQMVLGKPAIGLTILVAELLLGGVGLVLIDAGAISYLFLGAAVLLHVVQTIHALVVGDAIGGNGLIRADATPPPPVTPAVVAVADAVRR